MVSTVFAEEKKFVSPDIYDAFFVVIERLERTIDRETLALKAQRLDLLADFTLQKRQSYVELNRIMRSLENTIPSEDIIRRLKTFRGKLEANDATLKRHMRAVEEVAAIIVRAIREFESDGTYSRGHWASQDYLS
jgi:hypothetical protein